MAMAMMMAMTMAEAMAMEVAVVMMCEVYGGYTHVHEHVWEPPGPAESATSCAWRMWLLTEMVSQLRAGGSRGR